MASKDLVVESKVHLLNVLPTAFQFASTEASMLSISYRLRYEKKINRGKKHKKLKMSKGKAQKFCIQREI